MKYFSINWSFITKMVNRIEFIERKNMENIKSEKKKTKKMKSSQCRVARVKSSEHWALPCEQFLGEMLQIIHDATLMWFEKFSSFR